jgi:archaellum component FlaF (FlaF/FlaG flagellin family)
MKAVAGLVIAILIIFAYRLFWPSSEFETVNLAHEEVVEKIQAKAEANVEAVAVDEVSPSSQQLNTASDSDKRKLMEAEYEILEQTRKKLKSHIGLLKHQMWGLKFPAATAKEISTTVMGANQLLKNPPMLGAFSSIEEIKNETAKIEFAEKSLTEIDEIVKTKIEENANSVDQTDSAMQ